MRLTRCCVSFLIAGGARWNNVSLRYLPGNSKGFKISVRYSYHSGIRSPRNSMSGTQGRLFYIYIYYILMIHFIYISYYFTQTNVCPLNQFQDESIYRPTNPWMKDRLGTLEKDHITQPKFYSFNFSLSLSHRDLQLFPGWLCIWQKEIVKFFKNYWILNLNWY